VSVPLPSVRFPISNRDTTTILIITLRIMKILIPLNMGEISNNEITYA